MPEPGDAPRFPDGSAQVTLDAVFANLDQSNRVCLGDGGGSFSCSDVSTDMNLPVSVALGEVIFSQIFTDGFESGDTSAWTTTVP